MKPSINNYHKNSNPVNSVPKRIYPINAKVIFLSDHKPKKKSFQDMNIHQSRLFTQRENLAQFKHKRWPEKLNSLINKRLITRVLFVALTASVTFCLFFLIGLEFLK